LLKHPPVLLTNTKQGHRGKEKKEGGEERKQEGGGIACKGSRKHAATI